MTSAIVQKSWDYLITIVLNFLNYIKTKIIWNIEHICAQNLEQMYEVHHTNFLFMKLYIFCDIDLKLCKYLVWFCHNKCLHLRKN